MFDFQATLDEADAYAKAGEYALATFNYWLINFAYEDEEFPYYYTDKIGERGRKGFLKYVNKHKDEILNDKSYLSLKEQTIMFSTYRRYFENFERVVKYFINRKNNKGITKSIDDGDMWIGFPY